MNIEIKHIAGSYKNPDYKLHPDLPQPPFSMSIIGPSRSGKSNLIKNLLLRKELLAKVWKPKNIFIFCQSIHLNDDYELFDEEVHKYDKWDEDVVQAIYDESSNIIKTFGKKRLPPILIICDDCFDDAKFTRSKALQTLFFRGRHLNISLIMSGQKYSSLPRGCRLNTTDLICFRPYNENELDFIIDETCSKRKKREREEKLNEIYKIPYSFIYYDFLNKEPSRRIRIGFHDNLSS